ncbi:hypothetical protein Aph02nite_23630 [Actinoplanes philippinensis]|uniref:KDO2-lipid IV(A) lauroyltransferase n=1 Tax=Actinoplanes philippinensis TaxID=35752 RepID=A0A1I2FYQ6_9ACTN|nr:phosphatidylinositol mannoside acyltransferase [Actinoplanes philippinensis]GIE76413.1 hypothetical protein Aph02nite_23630 [Actinoplanes philippinensis]SFF09949.1 KDO2-lipid IV(A) lauroyltransferase [Actinoplanes philippinensis]
MGEDLTSLLYGLAWRVTPRLPDPVAAFVFDGIATGMRWSGAGGVRQLRVNLAQVLGQAVDSPAVTAAAGLGVHSYLRYWREFFGLTGWSRDRIRDTVVFESLERVAAARAAGRGVVLALPHSANWDLAGAGLVVHGYPFTTVAQRLRPESLYQRFVSHRAALGATVLPADETRRTVTTLAGRLRAGEVVCLVGRGDDAGAGRRLHRRRPPASPRLARAATGLAAARPGRRLHGPVGRGASARTRAAARPQPARNRMCRTWRGVRQG